jgi:hypothetical protein
VKSWAGPPLIWKQRPLIARNAWPERVRRRPILHDCEDDRISFVRRNRTRSFSLMLALRVNSGTWPGDLEWRESECERRLENYPRR